MMVYCLIGILSWLVYIIGAEVGGRVSFSSTDEHDAMDGELVCRLVFISYSREKTTCELCLAYPCCIKQLHTIPWSLFWSMLPQCSASHFCFRDFVMLRVCRVLQLMNVTDARLSQRGCEKLDLAILYFIEQFRKIYIGEQVQRTSKVSFEILR